MLDDYRTVIETPFAEGTTPLLTGEVVDETGALLPASALSTLTFTLIDRTSGLIVNGRDAVNILNANGGVVDEDGAVTFRLAALDLAVLDDQQPRSGRIARLEWTWPGGGIGAHEVWFSVDQVAAVP